MVSDVLGRRLTKIKNFTFFAISGNKVAAYQKPLYVALPLVIT